MFAFTFDPDIAVHYMVNCLVHVFVIFATL